MGDRFIGGGGDRPMSFMVIAWLTESNFKNLGIGERVVVGDD